MAEPAAKMGDQISGTSQVWVQLPGSSPTKVPFNYKGLIDKSCSSNVFIMGKPAAIVGSTATTPPETQVPNLLSPINNTATIAEGSITVLINNKSAARNEDEAEACDYSTTPSPGECDKKRNGKVKALGSVFIGG